MSAKKKINLFFGDVAGIWLMVTFRTGTISWICKTPAVENAEYP
jgi:hypothetical protein